MAISITPLSPTIGAEIRGIDPLHLSDADRLEFRRLFDKHHILLMRNVDPDESAQINLTECLGTVSYADNTMNEARKYTHISNVHADGRLPNGELLFHADHMFLKQPLKAISLYAMMVPSVGGETRYLDIGRAYRELPADLKTRIAGLSARQVYDYDANRGNSAPNMKALSNNVDSWVHPLVWPHPESGEPILFVCRLFTVEILGLPEAESRELLETLFQHVDKCGEDYSHKWQVGDYLVWDNRILQHARNNFPPTEKRAMRRMPIGEQAAA